MRPVSREARYRFKPGKEYYSWVVDVKGRELPCYGGMRQVVKVTLATPYVRQIKKAKKALVASQSWEAVVWLFPDEKNKDRKFIDLAGITSTGKQFRPPAWKSKCLWCVFCKPDPESQYQPLKKCWPVEDDEHLVEPEVVAARSFREPVFRPGGGVLWREEEFNLAKIPYDILKELNDKCPDPVSPEQLRQVVPNWKDGVEDRTITVTVSKLNRILPAGLSIGRRDGANGWSLIIS